MDLQTLLSRTEVSGDCLEWTGCLSTDGYPRRGEKGNSNIKVHREVFELVNGYQPPVVRHTCDNPPCINPDHLIGGSNIENVIDRHSRKRTHNQVDLRVVEEVFRLRDDGMTYKQIAETLDLKTRQVEYILLRLRKES